MEKTIVILGGGIGGVVAARELRRNLGTRHRIVLIDRSDVHSFPPSYLWVMVGWRKPAAILKPLPAMEKHRVEFYQATVRAIHPGEHRVETDRASFRYDYLVVALGAELLPQLVRGWAEGVHSFYTLEDVVKLRDALVSFSGGTIAIVIGDTPYKCPPAPYEAAFILESFFSHRTNGGTTIKVFTPEPAPLPAAGPAGAAMLSELLRRRRIELHVSHKVSSISSGSLGRRISFENGASYEYDMLIFIPPHRPPQIVRAAGLTDGSGWVTVDPKSLRTQFPEVFAIGDVTTVRLPSGGTLPKAGVFAAGEAETVAHNIASELRTHAPLKDFGGMGHCYLETGYGRAGYIHGDFFAKPVPVVSVDEPSVAHHWKKVVFEKYWLWRWF